jgi:Icc-related predicted phosphoesterase
LLKEVRRAGPRLVVGGHVHFAHGTARDAGAAGTVFVNAANCGGGPGREGYVIEWPPVVVDI